MSSDDTNGRHGSVEYVVSAAHDERVKSLERRFGQLVAKVDIALESLNHTARQQTSALERIEDLLISLHASFDSAMNAVDGLDVRNRLSVVEEAVAKPRRAARAGKK